MSTERIENLNPEQLDAAFIKTLDLGEFDTTSDWFTMDLVDTYGVNIRSLKVEGLWVAVLSEHDPEGIWNAYRRNPDESANPMFIQCRFLDEELKGAVMKAVLASIVGDTIEINDEEQGDEQA